MFEWLKRKPTPTTEVGALPRIPSLSRLVGHWVWLELPRQDDSRPFLGFVYFDAQAGVSAKGALLGDTALIERPGITVRSMPCGGRALTAEELAAHSLPASPPWLHVYGEQPLTDAPWRLDPALESLHPQFPDDLQVLVHDGEPRRSGLQPELCWVRISAAEPAPPRLHRHRAEATSLSREGFERAYATSGWVYSGTLLNQPHHLAAVRQGDVLRFLAGGGLKHPLMVTAQYLSERGEWIIQPCNQCGAGECFDPPSVMAKTRFANAPADAIFDAFTAHCSTCAGSQLLSRLSAEGNRPAERLER